MTSLERKSKLLRPTQIFFFLHLHYSFSVPLAWVMGLACESSYYIGDVWSSECCQPHISHPLRYGIDVSPLCPRPLSGGGSSPVVGPYFTEKEAWISE